MASKPMQPRRKSDFSSRPVPLIHPSWRPDAANDRAPVTKLKPEEFWERLGL